MVIKQFKFFLVASVLFTRLAGINASPDTLIFIQPDGTVFQGYNRGDEWVGWHETLEGWTIMQSSDDWWVYVSGIRNNKMLPSSANVGLDPVPGFDIDRHPLVRHLQPESELSPEINTRIQLSFSRTDTFQLPLLLVDFPDYPHQYSDSLFNELMNAEGYGHPNYPNSGSFRDYYLEVSYNQFDPNSQVINWVSAPNEHDYYAYSGDNYYPHVIQLIRAAVDSAEARGLDWSKFDNDGDGYVDALNVVHAGPGAEEGDYSNIWSHKWSLSAWDLAVQYDGVWINSYTINPEIQINNIVAIGVICHEFGHALGLPDLYDTDYSSSGAGKLALMGSGSWGTGGTTPWYPSSLNAWSKAELGWVNTIELASDEIALTVEQSHSGTNIFRVNHPNDGSEYWLIENRQKVGTDIYMPQPGLLIWHIDLEKTSGWTVNDDEPHYGVGLEQADGYYHLENGMLSDGGDPFPGISDKREFNNGTVPNTKSYYGVPSMIIIDSISDPDSIMYFDLTFGEYLIAEMSLDNGSGMAYDTGLVSVSLSNTMPVGMLEFEFVSTPDILTVEAVQLTDRATADSVLINENFIQLINPAIASGNGIIMNVQLFANTGIDYTVNLSFDNIIAADTAQNEIGFIITEGTYQINAREQQIRISDGFGVIGLGGSYSVSLTNTVPIKMIIISLTDTPDLLVPSDELFTDLNNNDRWDEGEPLNDWNGDGQWTPVIQLSERMVDWNHSIAYVEDSIVVSTSNWFDPLPVGEGDIFIVNNFINPMASTGTVTISGSSVTLMDQYGNDGIPVQLFTGNVTLLPYTSIQDISGIPVKFDLIDNYPNPFNSSTTIIYHVPYNSSIVFTIYNILGASIYTRDIQQKPGIYAFKWDGKDNIDQRVGSGVYFIRMKAEQYVNNKTMLLLK